jgi:hypothetical protein
MPADVHQITWGADPDKVPVTPVTEVKEALIGDGEQIIGAIPDIGPVESATVFDVSYYDEAISLGEAKGIISDVPEMGLETSLDKLSPEFIYSNLKGKYGESFLNWEPETLKIVLIDDFELDEIPDNLWESILATRVAGDGVTWDDYVAFEKAALAISGNPVHPGKIQHVSVEEMASLYKLMSRISPDEELSDEVARYIAARMHTDGYLYCGHVFPDAVQGFIFELGASRVLTDSVHEHVQGLLMSENVKEAVKESIEDLGTSEVDIQIARYISLL